MTEHHENLPTAIAALYEAFIRYPLNAPIPGCECCVFPEDQAALARTALRALSSDALEKFGSKAMTTWGSVDDFRHFLPRLLELEASGPVVTLTRMSEKLAYADWNSWPTPEQDAVATYYRSLAATLLTPQAPDRPLSEVLEDAVTLGIDMAAFLADWRRQEGEARAIMELAKLFLGGDATSFWQALALRSLYAGSIAWQQLRGWLLDPCTGETLIEAYLSGKAGSTVFDDRQLSEIAMAVDHIEMRYEQLGLASL